MALALTQAVTQPARLRVLGVGGGSDWQPLASLQWLLVAHVVLNSLHLWRLTSATLRRVL